MTVPFHAHGMPSLFKEAEFLREREGNRARRMEELLVERASELGSAGVFKKQAILRAIRKQVDRELSIKYCLF